MNENSPIETDPNVYIRHYLVALLQHPKEFIALKQLSGIRSSSLATASPSIVSYSIKDKALIVRKENDTKTYLISSIEKVQWGTVEDESGLLKYININFKNDRVPLVIHGPIESMELWYDGICVLSSNAPPETGSTKAKLEMFTKAIEIASYPTRNVFTVPDPPHDLNFHVKIPE